VALPIEFRLKGKAVFDKFRIGAKSYRSKSVLLKVASGPKCSKRFGVVTPRRIGSAVVRNRIKRVLLEWIRTHLGLFPDGFNYLIILVGDSNGGNIAGIREDLETIVRKHFNTDAD